MKEVVSLKNAGIYQEGVKVLNDVNLSVSQTEFVYLIGKTGSGKSSLIRTLWGDLPLKQGDGQVAGISLNKLQPDNIPVLRRRVGMVFQDFQLFPQWSVAENLRFVLEPAEGRGMDDAVAIAPEIVARDARRLRETATAALGGIGRIHGARATGFDRHNLLAAQGLLSDTDLTIAPAADKQ